MLKASTEDLAWGSGHECGSDGCHPSPEALLVQDPVCCPEWKWVGWACIWALVLFEFEPRLGNRWGPLKARKTGSFKELRLPGLHGIGRYICKNKTQGQEIKKHTSEKCSVWPVSGARGGLYSYCRMNRTQEFFLL